MLWYVVVCNEASMINLHCYVSEGYSLAINSHSYWQLFYLVPGITSSLPNHRLLHMRSDGLLNRAETVFPGERECWFHRELLFVRDRGRIDVRVYVGCVCPNKQSDSDPIPTWLLKECASLLVPTITIIVNFSLTSGQFHPIVKESVIFHRLRNLS